MQGGDVAVGGAPSVPLCHASVNSAARSAGCRGQDGPAQQVAALRAASPQGRVPAPAAFSQLPERGVRVTVAGPIHGSALSPSRQRLKLATLTSFRSRGLSLRGPRETASPGCEVLRPQRK